MSIYCLVTFALNLIVLSEIILENHSISVVLPDWFSIPGYRLTASLFIDKYSVSFALLSSFIFGIIAKFSFSYLHRDEGYRRYFVLISILSLGIQFICYAGSLDLIFLGWELVGITSVHLIAFFQDNVRSVQNSFRALIYYRICDAFLLVACIFLHYFDHGTEFSVLQKHSSEPISHWIGLLIILSTLAKSAQFPLSNWLFRAMEGPTTSSAIYYGALSAHLGPFLLMRTASLWMDYVPLRIVIFSIGFISVVYSSLVGKTRSDIKSGLAYSTIVQIGMIYIELGLGFEKLALIHTCSHALMRTWQFLRSSSVIHDFLESPLTRDQFRMIMNPPENQVPEWKKKLYIHALNGFYLDSAQSFFFERPFQKMVWFLKKQEFFICWGASIFIALSFLPIFRMEMNYLIVGILFVSMIFSLIGYVSKPIPAFICIILSEVLFCYCGFIIGGIGAVSGSILLSTIVLIAPLLLYLMYRLNRDIDENPDTYKGLFRVFPKTAVSVLLLGWMLVGVPGGPVQTSEDMFFFKLIEVSPWTTIFFSVCSMANYLVFYNQYSRIFYGSAGQFRANLLRSTPSAQEVSPSQYLLVASVILLLLVLGLFPHLFVFRWD
jgi:NADH:ubiquinone oxidoreductase subunit 5 (subunit L)/multisubunit Na+/H+ antiporter MnhA subunit